MYTCILCTRPAVITAVYYNAVVLHATRTHTQSFVTKCPRTRIIIMNNAMVHGDETEHRERELTARGHYDNIVL